MRQIIITEILPLIYIFEFVQSGNVKYMPLGYDGTQDKDCVVNKQDIQPTVIYQISIINVLEL